jgi:hypothetical protein
MGDFLYICDMKNIYLIPTNKPSFGRYLVFNKENTLCIWDTELIGGQKTLTPHHIYITSDEEIKEGYAYYPELNEVLLFDNKHGEVYEKGRQLKIILTTDHDLIANGVQDIDDEFLEWFVKNPSCEFVEVKKRYSDFTVDPFVGYKIIIPKEELREEEFCHYSGLPSPSAYIEQPKQELLPDFKITKNIFDFVNDLSDTNKKEPKQKTLEEAANHYAEGFEYNQPSEHGLFVNSFQGFIRGAKSDAAKEYWLKKFQQEQDKKMYSEEEVGELVYNIIGEYGKHYGIMIDGTKLNDLFKQFKKK